MSANEQRRDRHGMLSAIMIAFGVTFGIVQWLTSGAIPDVIVTIFAVAMTGSLLALRFTKPG